MDIMIACTKLKIWIATKAEGRPLSPFKETAKPLYSILANMDTLLCMLVIVTF